MHQLTFILARREDLTPDDFAAWLLGRHVELVRQVAASTGKIVSYRVALAPVGLDGSPSDFDAVTQITAATAADGDAIVAELIRVGTPADSAAHTSRRIPLRLDLQDIICA